MVKNLALKCKKPRILCEALKAWDVKNPSGYGF